MNHKLNILYKLDQKAIFTYIIPAFVSFIVVIIFWFFSVLFDNNLDNIYKNSSIYSKFSLFVTYGFLIITILFILSVVWAYLNYLSYKYFLSDKEIIIENGVLNLQKIFIPYNRIQNVDIYRNWLDRLLGLSSVRIHTAGYHGGGKLYNQSEGHLPGLDREVAEKLKEDISQFIH